MPDLGRSVSNPELKSMPSTSNIESPDLLRQKRSAQKKDKGREQQEVVASSSTQHQTDILRNLDAERRSFNSLHDEHTGVHRSDFTGALSLELGRRRQDNTINASHDVPMRTMGRDFDHSDERQPMFSDQDLRRLEEGMGRVVREELNRQNNRPRTWREVLNTDGNSVASYIGGAASIIGIAGVYYTLHPDKIPH